MGLNISCRSFSNTNNMDNLYATKERKKIKNNAKIKLITKYFFVYVSSFILKDQLMHQYNIYLLQAQKGLMTFSF